ncbi:PEP-CTERM sorting domain-containing protein [Tunturiibacter lichenicola]|uniref:PEP-CTERM sorting domain-containing protein n=1 Tax=Tunturiibacter lichenicola TaxID=2051959 RepID=UPI0021B1DB7E|nr:PEP-CTERM sorting domain-containing protein [Edaphobacter lichenicola]
MKLHAAFLALVTLALLPAVSHADTISATVDTGSGTQIITPTLKGGADVFNYEVFNTDLFSTSLETFTATYTDLTGTLGVLNVTESCVAVTVVFRIVAPCKSVAFSFTDATLGDITVGTFLGLDASAKGNVASVNFDGSIGAGTGSFDFKAANSPVPEPGTLSLMATGLIGAAGVLRRKFATAS